MPANPWHAYSVRPIAPTLRVEDLSQGLTSDMVIPIAPNTSHPNGRAPVHTEQTFPFSNCYFWYQYEIMLRVNSRPEMFDHTDAVALSTAAYCQMNREFREDITRSLRMQQERAPEAQSAPHPEPQSDADERDSSSGSEEAFECADGMPPLDLFGDDADPMQTELLPLVDLWLDLTAHLTEDTIPDPEGLFKETEAIVS